MLLSLLMAPSAVASDYKHCLPPLFEIGADTSIFAVGTYQGKTLGWRLDSRDNLSGGLIQVVVNAPGRRVLLLLSAYESSLWQIGWTEQTEIAGLVAIGYHPQAVTGLPPNIPMMVFNNSGQGGICPAFYSNEKNPQDQVRAITGRMPDQFIISYNSKVIIGDILRPEQKVVSAGLAERADLDLDWPVEEALLKAVRKGRLKPASMLDYAQWVEAGNRGQNQPNPPGISPPYWMASQTPENPCRCYLVNDPDFFPPPKTAQRSYEAVYRPYVFFLPPGYPDPKVVPKGVVYLRLGPGDCLGAADDCRDIAAVRQDGGIK